jgi:hypothetical protein
MEVLVEKLAGRRSLEKGDKRRHDPFPELWTQFVDVLFQQLLKARRPDSSERVVLFIIKWKVQLENISDGQSQAHIPPWQIHSLNRPRSLSSFDDKTSK